MAIAYRAGSSAGNATGTNVTVTKPSGVADGDILLACTYREAGAWTLPAGWAWVNSGTPEQVNNTANAWVGVAWKRASSEGSSYTFNLSTSTWRIVVIGAYSGCATSGNPWNVYGSNSGTLTTVVAPSITTTVANTMCVVATANYDGSDVTAGASGYTQRAELGGDEFFEKATAATGATGTVTLARGGSPGTSASWHIALMEPQGGGGITGSGITPFGTLSISAAGTIDVTGAAAPAFAPLTLGASGAVDVVGAGAPGFGALPLSAAGAVDVTATSALAWAGLALDASGSIGNAPATGDADLVWAALAITSAGTVEIAGAAELAFGALSISGLGVADVAGVGLLPFSALSLVAAGLIGNAPAIGDAALQWDAFGLVAAGSVEVQGTCAVAFGALNVAATGGVEVQGAALVAWAALSVQAEGVVGNAPIIGEAALDWPAWGLVAAGVVEVAGDAALAFGALVVTSAGGVALAGDGALQWGGMMFEAAGALSVGGEAALVWGGMAFQAAGVTYAIVAAVVVGGRIRAGGRSGSVYGGRGAGTVRGVAARGAVVAAGDSGFIRGG